MKTIITLCAITFGATIATQSADAQNVIALADTAKQDSIFATLDTNDRYVKLVLYRDQTWGFLELDRPHVSDEDFEENWDNDQIHAYKGISMDSIPDEIVITLVDSLHTFCPPIVGNVRSRYMFRKKRPHKGTDIPLQVGTPVYAAFDGKVRVVKTTKESGGYGNLIVLRHPNGLETYYGHLNKHAVSENDIVKAGDLIGYGGNTGRSTGPHLHFESRFMGQAFDPERLIDFANGKLRTETITLKKSYYSIYSHYGMTDKESEEASKRKIHVIKSGDTLGGLAARYGTTVNNICKLNGFKSTKVLRIGERIIVR